MSGAVIQLASMGRAWVMLALTLSGCSDTHDTASESPAHEVAVLTDIESSLSALAFTALTGGKPHTGGEPLFAVSGASWQVPRQLIDAQTRHAELTQQERVLLERLPDLEPVPWDIEPPGAAVVARGAESEAAPRALRERHGTRFGARLARPLLAADGNQAVVLYELAGAGLERLGLLTFRKAEHWKLERDLVLYQLVF